MLAYEIAIPADSEWHDTNITIYPNNQLQIGFRRGTAGNVAIRVGDVSDAFNQSQPVGVWYEYNLVRQLRGNRFDRLFKTADTLKVRSGQNDVFIRVAVSNGKKNSQHQCRCEMKRLNDCLL